MATTLDEHECRSCTMVVVSGDLSRYQPSTLREVTFSPIELEVIKDVGDASVSSMGIDHDRHGLSVQIFKSRGMTESRRRRSGSEAGRGAIELVSDMEKSRGASTFGP